MDSNIEFALEAKSDQLNAVDIMGADRVITIRDVKVKRGDQPVSIYFDGDNNRPWKPSKGMLRVLAAAWGINSSKWIGKHARLYFEPSVTWAGKEVGGIRIKALSDIDARGISCVITINRNTREPYRVEYLDVTQPPYPDHEFDKRFPAMEAKMQNGEMSLQQVISRLQEKGKLSSSQLKRLEEAAPLSFDDDDFERELAEAEQKARAKDYAAAKDGE